MCALSKTEELSLKATQMVKTDMSVNNSDFLCSLRTLSQS